MTMPNPPDGTERRQPPSSARTAEARDQVESLLEQFQRHTELLGELRREAAEVTAELASKDRLVKVRVDATGMLLELRIAPTAFDSTTPTALGRTITDLVRRGISQVRQQTQELFSPFTGALPDLDELANTMPELAELAATMRDLTQGTAQPESMR